MPTFRNVDPSHFATSNQKDFAAPPADAYPSRSASVGRAASVSRAAPGHFVSSNQRDFAAPDKDAYSRNVTPARLAVPLRSADPDHFASSNQKDFASPPKSVYKRAPTPPCNPRSVTRVDPSHFTTSNAADYVPHEVVPQRSPSRTVIPQMLSVSPDHYVSTKKGDYPAYDVSHYTPRRSNTPALSKPQTAADPSHFKTSSASDYAKPQTAADPSHFKTSSASDYAKPPADAYAKPTPVTPRSTFVRKASAGHFETSAMRDFCAPLLSSRSGSVNNNAAAVSVPRKMVAVTRVDPSHFTTLNRSVFKGEQNPRPAKKDPPATFSSRRASQARADPSHYVTSQQADFKAPPREVVALGVSQPRRRNSVEPTRVDPSHFVTSNARDYAAPLVVPKHHSIGRPFAGLSSEDRGFKSEYTGNYTPKMSPPRTRSPQRRVARVTHVDPSHFTTSAQRDFSAPPASAYRHASASVSREPRSVSRAPAEHYVSESRRAYGGGL